MSPRLLSLLFLWRWHAWVGFIVLLGTVLAAVPAAADEFSATSYVFGTLAEVTVVSADAVRARRAAEQVLREFDRMHRDLHAWQPGALVSLNQGIARGDRYIRTTPEIATLIRSAQRLESRSGGTFDPAVGRLLGLWNFHKNKAGGPLPSPNEIAEIVRAHPSMSDLSVQGETVISSNPTVQLDFGGYAKGYALDRAAAILSAYGITDALINVGGNIMALGRHGERPWRVALESPRGNSLLATIDLRNGEAIGTSGDYRRYYEIDGKRYAHIIDPRTGFPVPGVESVTILVQPREGAGALSDAGSKPIFIGGIAGWRDAATRMGISCALLIDSGGVVHVTRELDRRLRFSDRTVVTDVVP